MKGRSYVVRIYRQGEHPATGRGVTDRAELVGIVEEVVTGEHRSFRDATELWAILSGAPGKRQRARSRNGATERAE